MSQTQVFYKNPTVATVLSFFFPGLGQLYNGQIGKGITFMIAYLASILLMWAFIGFITTPILWIFGMVDAYGAAGTINEQLARQAAQADEVTKKCPQCAERVKLEAVIGWGFRDERRRQRPRWSSGTLGDKRPPSSNSSVGAAGSTVVPRLSESG